MSNKNKRAQQMAVEDILEKMLLWYVATSGKQELPQHAVDSRTYRGLVLHWLEPLLPGEDNPILIEEQLGDNWTMRLEIIGQAKILGETVKV